MFNCKRHGITYFGKTCKKCAKELEERNSYRYHTPPPAPDQIDASDVVLVSLLTNTMSEHVRGEMMPERVIDQPSFFEGGSSGGGGAERSFDSEPEKTSSYSDDSSNNDSSDSGSSDSGSSGGSDD
jgi:hypothetical protein